MALDDVALDDVVLEDVALGDVALDDLVLGTVCASRTAASALRLRDGYGDRPTGVGGFHDEIQGHIRHHHNLLTSNGRCVGGSFQDQLALGGPGRQQRIAGCAIDRDAFGNELP